MTSKLVEAVSNSNLSCSTFDVNQLYGNERAHGDGQAARRGDERLADARD